MHEVIGAHGVIGVHEVAGVHGAIGMHGVEFKKNLYGSRSVSLILNRFPSYPVRFRDTRLRPIY